MSHDTSGCTLRQSVVELLADKFLAQCPQPGRVVLVDGVRLQLLRERILIVWPRLAVLQIDTVVCFKASRVSSDMPGITRTTKGTFEFRIECGNDVGCCSLRKVLRDELVSFVSFPVAQFTIECLCATLRSVASHAGNVKAGQGTHSSQRPRRILWNGRCWS